MKEWQVSKPFYGMGEEALAEYLNELAGKGWEVLQILEPHLSVVAWRVKPGKKLKAA